MPKRKIVLAVLTQEDDGSMWVDVPDDLVALTASGAPRLRPRGAEREREYLSLFGRVHPRWWEEGDDDVHETA